MPPADQRLGRLEDPGRDFPFYNGTPVRVSGGRWLFVMVAVTLAFLLLALPIPWPGGAVGTWIAPVLFPVLPLAALAHVAPNGWRALFGPVGWRELRLMIGFALLNLVVSMSVGFLVRSFTEVTANAATSQLAGMDTAGRVAFYARTLPQLFGEEVITLLPFLALLHCLANVWRTGRRAAVLGAWVISSIAFGLIHLPTYQWNLMQCLAVIGCARLVLTLAWILTKNIWVSTGAHILNDWLLFSLSLIGAGLAAHGG